MRRSFVAISNDMTAAFTPHATTAGALGPTVEAVVPIFWPPGLATGANKLTFTVLHQGLPLATQGHDCGPGILHVHVIPDPKDAVFTIQSSRKAVFSTSRVLGQKQALAACGMVNLAPTPMLACSDPVSTAQVGAVSLLKNTVTFGMTEADMNAGATEIATEAVIDAIGAGTDALLGTLPGWAFKTLAKNAKKFGLQAYKAVSDDGALDFTLEVDAPYLGGNVAKRSWGPSRDADGDWSWIESGQIGPYKTTLKFEPIDGVFGDGPIVEVKSEAPRSADLDGTVAVERDGQVVTYESGFDTDAGTYDSARHGRVTVEEDKE